MSSNAFSSRSGGTDARPTLEYIRSNSGDRRCNASSATALMVRRDGPLALVPPRPQRLASSPGAHLSLASSHTSTASAASCYPNSEFPFSRSLRIILAPALLPFEK